MKKLSKQEFDLGMLLNNDEIFTSAKHRLSPDSFYSPKSKQLVEIMLKKGNNLEEILKEDKEIAVFAIQCANYAMGWKLTCEYRQNELKGSTFEKTDEGK